MGRTEVSTRSRAQWHQNALTSLRRAVCDFAQTHHVGCNKSTQFISAPIRKAHSVLGQVTEAELVTHIRSWAAAGSPLTRVEVRGIAYEYAIANEIGGFSGKSTNKCAGYYWLEGFMKRNSELSVKKAEIFPSLEPWP